MDLCHGGLERKIREIDLGRENLVVLSPEVRKEKRSWIRSCEMAKGAEESIGRRRCEMFQPLQNRHLAIADIDTPPKYVETVHNESGVKLAKDWHRREVFEGRQMNGCVQGCLKDPRDAPQVHRDCLLAKDERSKRDVGK